MEGMHRNTAIDPGLVRVKAYELWQSMGCPDGVADLTWFEAERQLRTGMAVATGALVSDQTPAAVELAASVDATTEPTDVPTSKPITQPPSSSRASAPKKGSSRRARR